MMTTTPGATPSAQAVQNAMASARAIRPAHAELMTAFEKPLAIRAGLSDIFRGDAIPLPDVRPDRLAQGAAVLMDDDLLRLDPWLLQAARELLPVLESSFPNGDAFHAIATSVATGEFALREKVRALLDGDSATISQSAEAIGVQDGFLVLALQMIAGAAIAGLAEQLRNELAHTNWSYGYCPVCASAPGLSTLSRKDDVQVEALIGGGGKKYLHCGLCGYNWRFKRNACPGCSNDDPHSREVLYAEKAQHERIEACSKCNGYLLCVDLREYEQDPNFLAHPLALVHLDILAQGKGYAPLSRCAWNSFS